VDPYEISHSLDKVISLCREINIRKKVWERLGGNHVDSKVGAKLAPTLYRLFNKGWEIIRVPKRPNSFGNFFISEIALIVQ
jgi:hypothetical protein